MKEMEKIKNWLRKVFITKYVITKKEKLAWLIFRRKQERKIEYVYGQTSLLAFKPKGFLQHFFTNYINQAKQLNHIQALLWLRWLKRINEKRFCFEMLPADKAVFITDLTGLTEN